MSNEKETKVSALDAKAKALANEEDEDTKIAKLLKNMPKWRFYSLAVLTVIWTVFQLYIKLVKPLDPWFQLPLHMCLALVVVWLYNPMVEKSKSHNKLWWIYDIFLIASSCFICWFFLSHAEQLNYRIFNVDVMTTTEVIVAVLLVINVMEAVRRVVSMSLFWVICFFLAYAWFGQYIPGLFRFSGISFPKLMEVLMYGENGIFGSPLVTSLGTLFYFLVFGTFFSNCGGGGVLIDGGMKLVSTCDYDISQPIVVPAEGNPFTLTMNAVVPNGVRKFTVDVTSTEPMFTSALTDINGSTTLDLVNPSSGAINVFTNLIPFPYGSAVEGKTEIPFDLSAAQIPILGFKGTHTFKMVVIDNTGCRNEIPVVLVVE